MGRHTGYIRLLLALFLAFCPPTRSTPHKPLGQSGYSLISSAFFILGLGIVMVASMQLYKQWQQRQSATQTTVRLTKIDQSLQAYFSLNGYYPCPALLGAALDSAQFGVESRDPADNKKCAGTFPTNGTGGRTIWNGALPVRTLNLPDEFLSDGWRHRFVFALSAGYASPSSTSGANVGAITIKDANGNNASSTVGNIAYVIITQGPDERGAYGFDGNLIAPCDTASIAGQNCAFQTNPATGGTFTNNVEHSYAANASNFTHRLEYRAVITACNDSSSGNLYGPKNIAYLIDTSGSMANAGGCPKSLGNTCSRIDVARWALRRVVPARLASELTDPAPGATMLTPFVDWSGTAFGVTDHLGNPTVTDAASAENTIKNNLCPSGNTPLGVHLQALSGTLGNGSVLRPNKLMVISDGINNNGIDPVTAAFDIHSKYPNIQIDIIDVIGNPSLKKVSDITGGTYTLATDGDKLLSVLLNLSGICGTPPTPPPPPVDLPECGSCGDWHSGLSPCAVGQNGQ